MQAAQKQEAYRVEGNLTGMLDKCFNACVTVSPFTAKELTADEAKCFDVCSWKYHHTHRAVDMALARAQVSPVGAPEQTHVKR